MNILAFDTSSHACSVALSYNKVVKTVHKHAPMQQAQLILPMIDDLLKSENMELTQLDAIAFGCGPGSFTGIRIATSVAQGLGYAMQIPLIPISSLAILAQAAYNNFGWGKLWAAVDARIQEIYWGQYEVNAHGLVELIGQEQIGPPETLVSSDSSWSAVGNAWEVYANQIRFHPLNMNSTQVPQASAMIQLAIPRLENKEWVDALHAIPIYLRDEVAVKTNKS